MATSEHDQSAKGFLGSDKEHSDLTLIQVVLAEDFGLSISGLATIDPLDRGDNSEIYTGTLIDEKVFIKVGSSAESFQIERAALDLLSEHSIPTPQTIAFRERAKHIEKPVVIQTAAKGIALSRLTEVDPFVWEAAGRTLQQINGITLEGFGRLEVVDGNLRGKDKAFVVSHMPDLPYLMTHGFIDDSGAQVIEDAHSRVDSDLRSKTSSSFLHTDFHAPHIFTDGRRISGIIDPNPRVGDSRYDVAMAHHFLPSGAKDDFNRGYGFLADDPLVEDFFLLIAANKVGYINKKGFTDKLPTALKVLNKGLGRKV